MSETTVWGKSADGRYALIVVGEAAHVGHVDGERVTGLRWECSVGHLGWYEDLYRSRFPLV